MKSSIDNALSMLKAPLPTSPPSAGMLPHEAVYTTSAPGMAGSASLESSPATSTGHEVPQSWSRRPSLPQIFDTPPHPAHGHSMSTSQAQGPSYHAVKSSGRPSFSSSRRPRSAGTDADTSTSSTPGRLRGKLSLLSMFKKAAGDSVSSTSSPGVATPESRDSFTGSAVTSASPSPVPERERGDGQRRARSRGASAHSPLRTRASESGPISISSATASGLSPPALSTVPSTRSRLGSGSESESPGPYPPLAVELHRKLSMERLRSRSGSGSSSTQNPSMPAERAAQSPSPQHPALPQSLPQSHRSPAPRSGILRPHGRSASSGQSTFQRPDGLAAEGSARSLRFDPTSTGASAVHPKRSGLNLDLKGSGSISSLRGETQGPRSPRSPWSTSSQTRLRERERDPSIDATNHRHRNYTIMDDEDEEGYGEVISPRIGLGLALESDLEDVSPQPEERPPSMQSQASREESPAMFPLPSPTAPPESGFDCPFSINRPPPEPLPLDATLSPPPSQSQVSMLGIHGVDNRARGDSFGSMSTTTDASLPVTPGPGPGLALEIQSPDADLFDLPLDDDFLGVGGRTRTDSSASRTNYLVERERDRQHSSRARTMSPPRTRAHPLDIDIRAISSHAQAEALVQRAQKDILDLQNVDIELPGLLVGSAGSSSTGVGSLGSVTTLPSGRTPLSAKLAAYGESLAIERRFKEKEDRERERELATGRDLDGLGPMPRSPTRPRASGETPVGNPTTPRDKLRTRASEGGIRKFSLDERPAKGPHAPARRSKPKRPHTSDGDTSDSVGAFLSPQKSVAPGHKSSLSSSAAMGSARLSPSPDRTAHARPPASSRTLPLVSTPSSFDDRLPQIVRSRTPDHDRSFVDSPSSAGGSFGVPLSRVSTAPPRHASPDIIAQRTLSEQERERARANKLMKMGLFTHDSFARAGSPYGHARNGGGSGSAGGGTAGKHRFGGFRGFVQTLTGKS
ncbi:hypothetical protein GSI_03550 [Ganoderma sinense ZZ0214-1]|uniref:Uncharacterized protein n=1 Tax=Ganoderma sinense ZZ0214-1 TaxID=1077348 RepID=A0A2G8SJ93_9APHY|nr:hypothetical protein GSI_03550 [Ganoderma sinense ZZ0214-1]